VVALFAQWDFGKPVEDRSRPYPKLRPEYTQGGETDSRANRLKWFRKALLNATRFLPDTETVYIPHGIGCGLAGGHWEDYFAVIQEAQALCPAQFIILKKPVVLRNVLPLLQQGDQGQQDQGQ
jgi:hypothetical protein